MLKVKSRVMFKASQWSLWVDIQVNTRSHRTKAGQQSEGMLDEVQE
jgi:hypothetical protein